MSLGHGAKIVKDGLVFAYDMGSKQSFKGKPTTNIIAAAGKNCSLEYSGSSYPFVSQNITSQVIAAWSSGSTTFAMQFEGYRDYVAGGSGGGNDGYPVMYIYFTDWSWSTTISRTSYEWSHVGKTFTMPDPSTKNVYFAIYHMNSGNRGRSYARNFQLEHGNIVTPFVDGTRSNTEAIIDWKGGNTITVDSLTYNNDNTFSWDASGRQKVEADDPSFAVGTSDFAMEFWVKYISASSYFHIGVLGSQAAGMCLKAFRDGIGSDGKVYLFGGGGTYNSNGIVTDYYLDLTGKHTHLVVTRIGGTMYMYRNGILKGSYSNPYNVVSTNFTIGDGVSVSEYSSKEIPISKLYNRGLSAEEVKQNFNALRGRFGI